jgi:hypothetical protein
VRRLRRALAELGTDGVTEMDSVTLPPNLDRIVQAIRSRIDSATEPISCVMPRPRACGPSGAPQRLPGAVPPDVPNGHWGGAGQARAPRCS